MLVKGAHGTNVYCKRPRENNFELIFKKQQSTQETHILSKMHFYKSTQIFK